MNKRQIRKLKYNIILLGESNSGKSSLINRFVNDNFDDFPYITYTGDHQTK